MESSEAQFMRCLSYYTLFKAGKAEIVLRSEQLQADRHIMYDGKDVYAITTW